VTADDTTGWLAHGSGDRPQGRGGPVDGQAEAIDAALSDPRSVGIVVVATPEQMPVSEALDLHDRPASEFGIALDGAVVNRIFSPRFTAEEATVLASVPEDPGGPRGAVVTR
jgi:hypothetical protein